MLLFKETSVAGLSWSITSLFKLLSLIVTFSLSPSLLFPSHAAEKYWPVHLQSDVCQLEEDANRESPFGLLPGKSLLHAQRAQRGHRQPVSMNAFPGWCIVMHENVCCRCLIALSCAETSGSVRMQRGCVSRWAAWRVAWSSHRSPWLTTPTTAFTGERVVLYDQPHCTVC